MFTLLLRKNAGMDLRKENRPFEIFLARKKIFLFAEDFLFVYFLRDNYKDPYDSTPFIFE